MFKRKSRKKKLAGLDIGSSSVRCVELSSKDGKAALVYLASETLPPNAIEDGQIIGPATVSNAILNIFSNQQSQAQEMAIAVNGYSAILKNIVLPSMSDEELVESFDWHAEEHIPYDLMEASLDYQVIESLPDVLRILMASCRRDTVENLKAPIDATGKQTSIVDFELLALGNCYIYNYEPEEDYPVVLVDIGASSLGVNIIRGRRAEFMRTVQIGDNDFTQVALEIRKTLDFHIATSEIPVRMEKLILTGGSSRIEGLVDSLSCKFEVPVEQLDPFRRIECDESVYSRQQLSEVAPEMAVAVGLALRGIENAATFTINLLDAEKRRDAFTTKSVVRMKTYYFTAHNRRGDLVTGERVATSRKAFKQMLKEEGLTPLSGSKELRRLFSFTSRFSRERVSAKELAKFTRRFTLLIDVGVPLVASFEVLAHHEKNRYFGQVLRAVVTHLEDGDRLADALTRYPRVFDRRYVNLIDCGETGGILDLVLARMQVLMEKPLEWRRRSKLALLYPLTTIALLLLTVLGFTSSLAGPRSNNSQGLGRRFITSLSHITFGPSAVIILLFLIASIVAIFFFYRSNSGRKWVDAQLLRTPLVGSFLRKKEMAWFARLFGSLLSNGCPILLSFEICAGEARNVVFKEAINDIRRGVERGSTLLEPMERNDVFTKFDVAILHAGEQSGALDAFLNRLADFYEHEFEMTYAELPLRIVPFLAGLYILIVGLLLYYR